MKLHVSRPDLEHSLESNITVSPFVVSGSGNPLVVLRVVVVLVVIVVEVELVVVVVSN